MSAALGSQSALGSTVRMVDVRVVAQGGPVGLSLSEAKCVWTMRRNIHSVCVCVCMHTDSCALACALRETERKEEWLFVRNWLMAREAEKSQESWRPRTADGISSSACVGVEG